LELDQIIPKVTQKTKIEAFRVVEELRSKERDMFFNLKETKYVEV
jgi:hypothetical protein